MAAMRPDWKRLADYLRAELAHRRWTQQDFATRAGVTLKTVNDLFSGRERKRLPVTTADLENAIGWAPGDLRRVLEGAEPRRLEVSPPVMPSYRLDEPRTEFEVGPPRRDPMSAEEFIRSSPVLSEVEKDELVAFLRVRREMERKRDAQRDDDTHNNRAG